ncbi:hypothetical protein [Hydrogenobaculum acidophilum]
MGFGLINGCGGGGGGGASVSSGSSSQAYYTIGGVVVGSNLSPITISDNLGDSISISSAGSFTFPAKFVNGQAYSVSVQAPASEVCTVMNGSGTIDNANVSSITISCTNLGIQAATNGSTAFAVFATNNMRVAFLPTSAGIIPFNIGTSSLTTVSTVLRSVSVPNMASSTLSLSFISLTFSNGYGPDACSVDSLAEKMVCIQYDSNQVAILDLSKFATTGNTSDIATNIYTLSDLPLQATIFSGDSCTDCGVATMPNISNPFAGQFIVAGYDGYHVYNYPSSTGTSSITAATVYSMSIGENMSVDPTRRWIIAPGSYVGTYGYVTLNIASMTNNTIYSMTISCSSISDTNQQNLCYQYSEDETDSEAIDPATGIIIMQTEGPTVLLEIDMSQATYSGTVFTAPYKFFSEANMPARFTGVLASGSGDFLFMGTEFSPDAWIGASMLPTLSGTTGTNLLTSYTFNPVYVDLTQLLLNSSSNPSCSSFVSAGDPHSEAMTVSLGGNQYGLYASGDKSCVAVVNLNALMLAPRDPNNPNSISSGYNLIGNGVVQFIPAQ